MNDPTHDEPRPVRTTDPAKTEVPAGPGDVGASDAPRRLKQPAQTHPERNQSGDMVLWVLWAVAFVAIALLLF